MKFSGGHLPSNSVAVAQLLPACVSGAHYSPIIRSIGHDWPSWFRTKSRLHIRHVYKTYQTPVMLLFNISCI